MISRRILCAVLLVACSTATRGNQAGGGPRILIADQGQYRLLVVDRETKSILAENRQLSRTDCVASWAAGEFLVCDGTFLVRVDERLKVIARIATRAQRLARVARSAGSTLLVSDPILRTIEEIDLARDAAPVWSVAVHWPQAAVRLETGHTLIADGTPELKEVDRSGNVARAIRLHRWGASLQALRDGKTLVGESGGYELFDADGSRLWSREWTGRVTCIQALAAGEILLCDPDARRVVIVDQHGDIAWDSGDVGFAWSAVHIP